MFWDVYKENQYLSPWNWIRNDEVDQCSFVVVVVVIVMFEQYEAISYFHWCICWGYRWSIVSIGSCDVQCKLYINHFNKTLIKPRWTYSNAVSTVVIKHEWKESTHLAPSADSVGDFAPIWGSLGVGEELWRCRPLGQPMAHQAWFVKADFINSNSNLFSLRWY